MQGDSQNRGKLILSVVYDSILVVSILVSPEVFASTNDLHDKTLYEVVRQPSASDKNPQIDVGDRPTAMTTSYGRGTASSTVYVANSRGDSVSIISADNNTRIGKDIPVGKNPRNIHYESDETVYVVNSDNGSISVISAETNTRIGKDIPVGRDPRAIAIADDKMYVVNGGSDTVSVISTETNTKIGKDIPVGRDPQEIAISRDKMYVVNNHDRTVSVISTENNTKIGEVEVGPNPQDIAESYDNIYVVNSNFENIPGSVSVINKTTDTKIGEDIIVGRNPQDIAISDIIPYTGYVANSGSDSVSVISTETNTKIGEDIPVGRDPRAVAVNDDVKTVYVANSGDNSVSVIDPTTNKVVAGITLKINPFNSGYILCDGLSTPAPLEQYFFVWSGAECVARPNDGFGFLNWEENLAGNSTQVINQSKPTSSLDSISQSLGFESNEPEAKLAVTKFGTFIANFKELPPAIPPQYWATLFAVVASAFVGSWLTPSFVGWRKTKKQGKRLDDYQERVKQVYKDTHLSEKDKEKELNGIKEEIEYAYAKGKLNEQQYNLLSKKIESFVNQNENKTSANKLRGADDTHITKRSPI